MTNWIHQQHLFAIFIRNAADFSLTGVKTINPWMPVTRVHLHKGTKSTTGFSYV